MLTYFLSMFIIRWMYIYISSITVITTFHLYFLFWLLETILNWFEYFVLPFPIKSDPNYFQLGMFPPNHKRIFFIKNRFLHGKYFNKECTVDIIFEVTLASNAIF